MGQLQYERWSRFATFYGFSNYNIAFTGKENIEQKISKKKKNRQVKLQPLSISQLNVFMKAVTCFHIRHFLIAVNLLLRMNQILLSVLTQMWQSWHCIYPLKGIFPLHQFPLCQFPLCQLPTLSIPILSIPIWSILTKWELTIDEVRSWRSGNW